MNPNAAAVTTPDVPPPAVPDAAVTTSETVARPPAQASTPKVTDGGGSRIPEFLHVIDTNARRETANNEENRHKGFGPRTHDLLIGGHKQTFVFNPHEPKMLSFAVAVKFLAISGFQHVAADGTPLPYSRRPKQPDELGAGEKFELADHQTVADMGELTNMALLQRVLELPGGEQFRAVDKPDRKAMIDFIKKSAKQRRQANMEKTGPRIAMLNAPVEAQDDEEEYLPAAEPEDLPGDRL
jgi:hypothetical protein